MQEKKSAGERVRGKKISLDTDKVKEFFDARRKKELPYLYNYTNYQDNRPELALERDRAEKARIAPLLDVDKEALILDIGCGVGRWGDEFAAHLVGKGRYIGVDYSEGILQLAKEHAEKRRNFEFYCACFQEICRALPLKYQGRIFDRILVNGVLMYINDDDLRACLESVKQLLADGGVVYIKESVSCGARLTLNQIYSEELTHDYSAIYRGIGEYEALWKEHFPADEGWKIASHGEVWDSALSSRRETTSYFWLVQRQ
ncbi:class I SAM-dependent methyltransferase [uncultured Selenomonas sp.]|uniref:class I SAM-dependent methyltransferase n=1 Tax=uncultured Selenomonas sp. TaxID=159275 RepID=UPI0028DCB1BB|nr:class I SAM-dependent methyltransferase [uncultured Selenomonas sp.]